MIYIMIAIPVIFILGWEFLALITGQEKGIPTWSRLIRRLQMQYSNGRIIVAAITFIIMESLTVWVIYHFYCGLDGLLC